MISGQAASVEDRLGEHRRPAADGQQHAHSRRPVALRALLGEHGGHVQGHRRAGQPGGARGRPAHLGGVVLVEPVAPELGLQVDHDQERVVTVDAAAWSPPRRRRVAGRPPLPGGRCPARYHRRPAGESAGRANLGELRGRAAAARDGLLGEVGRARRRRFTRARPAHTLGALRAAGRSRDHARGAGRLVTLPPHPSSRRPSHIACQRRCSSEAKPARRAAQLGRAQPERVHGG